MKHLTDHGMTYFEHLKFALFIGFSMTLAGFCCIIHGMIPCVFEKTASDTIKQLHEICEARKK